jgi:hypothetical protein
MGQENIGHFLFQARLLLLQTDLVSLVSRPELVMGNPYTDTNGVYRNKRAGQILDTKVIATKKRGEFNFICSVISVCCFLEQHLKTKNNIDF